MASLLRSPKSGSDWGPNELLAYNIDIQFQDAATFFDVNPLPQPAVPSEVLTRLDADDMTNDLNYRFVRYMDLAMDPVLAEESAVDDFAVSLLTMLGYAPRPRMTRTRVDIPITICGVQCHAKTDVCVVDGHDILLLVQEDKERKDPEPQLIAEAIAAFQANNTRRTRVLGQDAIDVKVMPGITLVGSLPTFYKISVAKELAQAVALGHFPATPTIVYAHLPAVPRPARRLSEGMKPLDNRRHILTCYEAFRQFVNWQAFHDS
ncbi:hypothetical protein DFH94DRAFT_780270 [Russula ochroleuca]|jgi:hypothetical protein|uniref:Uncharacterized protein n=1 Tax=Russula ochroleuca TaxID=152965 RepID=A0A9P5JVL0_9AGAM|nr:hypothetical protein DFH94DRAFT_780270 [Russula ochroleuca]